jgi:hypothetical protein
MSRFTYAGPYRNPTSDWVVMRVGEVVQSLEDRGLLEGEIAEGDLDKFCIAVKDFCACGEPCCSKPLLGYRFHTSAKFFDEFEDADAYVEAQADFFEADYDQYLEENRHAIVQMELYEMHMREQ